jgi:Holliday junction resolvase
MSKPEKKLQDKAIKYLKDNGIYYLNIYGSGRSGKGAPDIIACINGRFVCFELKVGSNDMQDDQKIHKLRIERSGGLHYTPYTLEEFIEIVEGLKNENERTEN